jgi:F-type H+-transporting ATPase subunit b
MKRLLAIAILVGVTASGVARAEEESHEGEAEHGIVNWWSWDYGKSPKDPSHKDWPAPFGYMLINFGVFAMIMVRLAGKPLKQYVADRHANIRKDLDEAAKLRREAEAQLREYEKKVANVDAEVSALVASIQKEAEAEKERMLAAATAEAARIKTEAERQITAEIARARLELRRGVIEAAVAAADELVRKQVGADDQRKMAERYVTDLESATKAGGRS